MILDIALGIILAVVLLTLLAWALGLVLWLLALPFRVLWAFVPEGAREHKPDYSHEVALEVELQSRRMAWHKQRYPFCNHCGGSTVNGVIVESNGDAYCADCYAGQWRVRPWSSALRWG